MERICQIGPRPDTYRYEDLRLERKGFLSIVSFHVAGHSHRQDAMERGNAVVILPADFTRRQLYMIEQPRFNRAFRENADARKALDRTLMQGESTGPIDLDADAVRIFEMPAGMIDGNESPEAAAVRELEEETGLKIEASALDKIGSYYPSIGSSTELITCYIAHLPDPVALTEAHGDGGEQITVWKMSWEEAFDLLDKGMIVSSTSAILLRELKIFDIKSKV